MTDTYSILVKPNAKKTEILSQNNVNQYTIAIKAPPEDNKANKELLSFMHKHFKKHFLIKQGLKSTKKVLQIVQ